MEPAGSAAVVRRVAELAKSIIERLGATPAAPIPRYQARFVDGPILGGRRDHRIKPLRTVRVASVTCMWLAVYAPAQQLLARLFRNRMPIPKNGHGWINIGASEV